VSSVECIGALYCQGEGVKLRVFGYARVCVVWLTARVCAALLSVPSARSEFVSLPSTCASSSVCSSYLAMSWGAWQRLACALLLPFLLPLYALLIASCVSGANLFVAWMYCTSSIVLSTFASRSANLISNFPFFSFNFHLSCAYAGHSRRKCCGVSLRAPHAGFVIHFT
jgi:hypothetical protein